MLMCLRLGALAVALPAIATPAAAIVRTSIFSGYVTDQSCGNSCAPDGLGLFGGGSLVGDAFTFTYRYDAEAAPVYYSGGDFQSGLGGANQYPSQIHYPPFGSGRLTINGFTVSLIGNQYGSIYRARGDHNGSAPRDYVQVYEGDNYHYVLIGVDFPGVIPGGSYDFIENFTFDTVGSFHPRETERNPNNQGGHDAFNQGSFRLRSNIGDTRGQLHVTNVRYLIGGVPEPASWAMMLTGFGAMGIALRSRRGATVSSG